MYQYIDALLVRWSESTHLNENTEQLLKGKQNNFIKVHFLIYRKKKKTNLFPLFQFIFFCLKFHLLFFKVLHIGIAHLFIKNKCITVVYYITNKLKIFRIPWHYREEY